MHFDPFDFKEKLKKWGSVFLLALLCIGGTELAVCRMVDPALYESITAPVRQGAAQGLQMAQEGLQMAQEGLVQLGKGVEQLAREGQKLWDQAWLAAAELVKPEPEPLEDAPDEIQLAGKVDVESDLSIVDPAISDFQIRKGLEYLTGGSVDMVYYNQTDEQWADLPYGRDHIGGYGCGPTAMAMAISSLAEDVQVDPEEMARASVQAGCWASGHGSSLAIVERLSTAYGLECFPLDPDSLTDEVLLSHLMEGEVLVALMTKGHFTTGGHFILLRGATLTGEVLVADPASRERSLMAWEPSLILEELSSNRSYGGPLWRVRLPNGAAPQN